MQALNAREAATELGQAIDLQGLARRHPYGTVAAALGIGYVLGGGLFTRLTARMLGLGVRLGMRLVVVPVIEDQVAELAMAFASPRNGTADVQPSPAR